MEKILLFLLFSWILYIYFYFILFNAQISNSFKRLKKTLIDQFVSFTDKNPLFNGHNPIKSKRKI